MKLSREEVLQVAGGCGIGTVEDRGDGYCIEWYTATLHALERFAAALYAKGAEDMQERALRGLRSEDDSQQLRAIIASIEALPITPNTEGEQ